MCYGLALIEDRKKSVGKYKQSRRQVKRELFHRKWQYRVYWLMWNFWQQQTNASSRNISSQHTKQNGINKKKNKKRQSICLSEWQKCDRYIQYIECTHSNANKCSKTQHKSPEFGHKKIILDASSRKGMLFFFIISIRVCNSVCVCVWMSECWFA